MLAFDTKCSKSTIQVCYTQEATGTCIMHDVDMVHADYKYYKNDF